MKFSHVKMALSAALALILGCPIFASDKTSAHENQINGYSLLYQLCDKEGPLDLILIVKTTPPDVADFAHRISKTAKDDTAILNDFQKNDPSIRFDRNGLPQFELDTRESIKEDKQHQLLFGTKGTEFARALLISQIEATTYGMHLSKVLAGVDPNPKRAAALQRMSDRWQLLRREAYRLIRST